MRVVATVLMLIVLALPLRAQEEADAVARGNELYRAGDFAAAAQAYREAIEQGQDGPRVHYNLGNALYLSERPGEAIAHYLAAVRMAPRDDDVRANLERAYAQRSVGPPAPPVSWLHAMLEHLTGRFTLADLAVAAAVCWWATVGAAALLILGVRRPHRVRRLVWGLGVITALLIALALGRWWGYHHLERAVIVAEAGQICTGPGESFEVVESAGEGVVVRVVRRDARWAEVVGESGTHGWISSDALMSVPGTVMLER